MLACPICETDFVWDEEYRMGACDCVMFQAERISNGFNTTGFIDWKFYAVRSSSEYSGYSLFMRLVYNRLTIHDGDNEFLVRAENRGAVVARFIAEAKARSVMEA